MRAAFRWKPPNPRPHPRSLLIGSVPPSTVFVSSHVLVAAHHFLASYAFNVRGVTRRFGRAQDAVAATPVQGHGACVRSTQ